MMSAIRSRLNWRRKDCDGTLHLHSIAICNERERNATLHVSRRTVLYRDKKRPNSHCRSRDICLMDFQRAARQDTFLLAYVRRPLRLAAGPLEGNSQKAQCFDPGRPSDGFPPVGIPHSALSSFPIAGLEIASRNFFKNGGATWTGRTDGRMTRNQFKFTKIHKK